MSEFKIIKIQKKENGMSKKKLYKQILSSSKKVKDIINNKKFDYLNNIVINKKLVNLNNYENDILEAEKLKILEEETQKRLEKNQKILEGEEKLKLKLKLKKFEEEQRQKSLKEEQIKKEKLNIENIRNKRLEQQRQKKLKEEQIKKEKLNIENIRNKKLLESKIKQNTQNNKKKVTFHLEKKKSLKQNNIETYFTNSKINKKSKKKNKILEIIKLLNKNKNYDSKIYTILKRLNRDFIVDILLALNLIKKRSNAPKKLLENILFSYITSNIIITYC